MKILVINAGSSSLKYKFWQMPEELVIASGSIEKIDTAIPDINCFRYEQPIIIDKKYYQNYKLDNHAVAVEFVLNILQDPEIGVIRLLSEINAVGHRVVHGGEKYISATIITPQVIADLWGCAKLAKLHNPANINGIEACQRLMPDTPMVAVFDTAFHQTMMPPAYLYALPYEIYEKYSVRRYGFHGISHQFITQSIESIVHQDVNQLKVLSCHLGNGASIAAIKYGQSIATSMGFTPLAGLPMGTRCGDVDPGVLIFLMQEVGFSVDQVDELLLEKSGLLGISGISNDLRDLHKEASNGNIRARLAVDIFVFQIKYFIGALSAAMGGVDVIVFTAGIGENDSIIRERVIAGLGYLGASLDLQQNNVTGRICDLSALESRIKILVIPTNEELLIARETQILARTKNFPI